MKALTMVGLGIVLGMAGALWYQQQTISRLRTESTARESVQRELEQLRSQQEQFTASSFDREEFERLKKNQSELLRLRGEISQLKKQLAVASSKPKETPLLSAEVEPQLLTTNDFVQMKTNLTVELGNAETLIAGRWAGDDGGQTLLMVTPELMDPAGNRLATGDAGSQILLSAQFISVSPQALQSLGQMLAPDRVPVGVFPTLLQTMKRTEGVNILSAPRVTTKSGNTARVSQIQTHDSGEQQINEGAVVEFNPTVSASGTGISLEIDATFTKRR